MRAGFRLLPGLVLVPLLTIGAVPTHADPIQTPVPSLEIVAGTGAPDLPQEGPARDAPLKNPAGVAVDRWGTVYVADGLHHLVEKIDRSGNLSLVAGTGTRGLPTPGPARTSMIGDPAGVTTDSRGNLYVADYGVNLVEKVTPDGRLSVVAGTGSAGPAVPGPATASPLDGPFAVAVDATGTLYIADSSNHRIEKVSAAGQLSFVAGNGSYGLSSPGPALQSALFTPTGVAIDRDGAVIIADRRNNRVEKVTPDGQLSVLAASGLAAPAGVAVDASGTVFVSEFDNHQVDRIVDGVPQRIVGTGSAGSAAPGPALDSPLMGPAGIAVGPAGDLYVADQGDHRLDRITHATAGFPLAPAVELTAPPTSSVVGATVTLAGTAWPGTRVDLRFHRAGTTGYADRGSVTAAADGSWHASYAADDDYRIYATSGTARSATALVQIRPTLAGPPAQVVRPNVSVVLHGTATPRAIVTLHFHRAGTPANDYSIVRTVPVSATGTWTRTFVASTDYRYYVSLPNGQRSPTALTQAR